MSYSCLEELQVDLDLHTLNKTDVLSKAGRKYNDGWLVITNDGYCHLFDKDGNLDDIKKITQLEENHIRYDITKIVIPDRATSIGMSAFEDCHSLTSVTIPDSMTSIGDWAFGGCRSLMSMTIGNSVTNIGYWAFACCHRLMSVTIPNSVMSIGNYAFEYCSGLTSVTIGNGVTRTSIGDRAFGGCNKLTDLRFKDKTLEQVKKMEYYPWGIEDESIIRVE